MDLTQLIALFGVALALVFVAVSNVFTVAFLYGNMLGYFVESVAVAVLIVAAVYAFRGDSA